MEIKTKFEIGQNVFILFEDPDKDGYLIKQHVLNKIIIEKSEKNESSYSITCELETMRRDADVNLHEKDIYSTEEDFMQSMKALWANRK